MSFCSLVYLKQYIQSAPLRFLKTEKRESQVRGDLRDAFKLPGKTIPNFFYLKRHESLVCCVVKNRYVFRVSFPISPHHHHHSPILVGILTGLIYSFQYTEKSTILYIILRGGGSFVHFQINAALR